MVKTIKIKKGLNIPLKGGVSGNVATDTATNLFAICPDDYPGYTWKAIVKSGDMVKVGSPLLVAKEDEALQLVSPIAGKVNDVCRGERRRILYISVEKSGEQSQENIDYSSINRDYILKSLKLSGLYAMMRQRPFDIVPLPGTEPRDIFITGFDSSPLAAEMLSDEVVKYLDKGIEILQKCTSGKVYLSISNNDKFESKIVDTYKIEGPHPAGNVGTQIAAISPINKGETVWTLDAITASRIGELYSTGHLNMKTYVALTGDEMKNPHVVLTSIGASLKSLLHDELKTEDKHLRVISGNVLTGIKVNPDNGFLRYPYRQITAIEEGDQADEFMGWASMNPKKYSIKRTFPAFITGLNKPFKFDARIKGGHRAMIMSGEYDKVFPMDIYPEYLLKSIIAKDIDKMEKLGIYEVAPEDFALAEFVDTSKIELQKIVREGLEYLRKETM